MKVEFEFQVNQFLLDAFYAHIDDLRAGSYDRNDLAAYDVELEEILKKSPDGWSDETKKDLSVYLMFRAGFQSAAGWYCEDFQI